MRTALLVVVICLAALAVAAQEGAQKPTWVQPNWPQVAPAPDRPNDVDILTGHAARRSSYPAPTVVYGYTQPYSYGRGDRFATHGFFFPRGRGRAPFFGAPFGPFFFSGFSGR